ncbi:hypothetical protein EMCRGX_G021178 [Ephydatia muelleri]
MELADVEGDGIGVQGRPYFPMDVTVRGRPYFPMDVTVRGRPYFPMDVTVRGRPYFPMDKIEAGSHCIDPMAGTPPVPLGTAAAAPEVCDSVHQQLMENNILLEDKIQELQAYLAAMKRSNNVKQWERQVEQWKVLHLSATETVRRQDKKLEEQKTQLEKQKAQFEKERGEREEEREMFMEERRRSDEQLRALEDKWRNDSHTFKKDRNIFEQERRGFEEERSKLICDIQTLKDQIRRSEERPKTALNTDRRLNEALKDVETLRSKNETLQREVQSLNSDREKLQMQEHSNACTDGEELEEQREQISALIGKTEKLGLEIGSLQSEKGTLQLELEKLREDYIDVNTNMEELELSNRELQGKVEDMILEQEKAAQSNLATNQTLQSQLQLSGTKVALLEEEVSNQRDENARVLEEIRRLKEQLAGSEADRQALIREREVLKGDLEALGGKLIMAVKQREDTLKKYKAVEAVLKGYEEECAKLLAELEAQSKRLREVEEEKAKVTQECEWKDNRLRRVETMRDEQLQLVDCLQAQLIAYREDLKRAPVEEELKRQIDQLQGKAMCKSAGNRTTYTSN